MNRQINSAQAILEATEQCMESDPSVYIMGLGVTDPKGVFGTTIGLEKKFGGKRVLDMPVAENGMTGIAIGSAVAVAADRRVDTRIMYSIGYAMLHFGMLPPDVVVAHGIPLSASSKNPFFDRVFK